MWWVDELIQKCEIVEHYVLLSPRRRRCRGTEVAMHIVRLSLGATTLRCRHLNGVKEPIL